MATAYQRLAALRDRAVEVRDSLPIGSIEGEFYTDYIAALEEAILEVTTAQPEPESEEEPKEVVMPERFDMDAMILDMWSPNNQMQELVMPNNQMAVWNPPATGICS